MWPPGEALHRWPLLRLNALRNPPPPVRPGCPPSWAQTGRVATVLPYGQCLKNKQKQRGLLTVTHLHGDSSVFTTPECGKDTSISSPLNSASTSSTSPTDSVPKRRRAPMPLPPEIKQSLYQSALRIIH